MSNRLEALRTFCVAAEAANFRDAANRLGVSPQVITRVVRELEASLGEPLFHRSTRGVALTRFGEQLAQRARPAVSGVDELFHGADRRSASEAGGIVRVAAPGAIGRRFLLEAMAPRLAAQPGLLLDLRLSDAIADVVDQQIDVGVRIGFLRDNRFVARPAAQVAFHIVAAPALLARTGRPRNLDALNALPTTALIDRNTGRPWPWQLSRHRQIQPSAPAFVTDDPEAECAAVVAGLGIGQLPDYLARPHLEGGRLVAVFAADEPEPWKLYVYRPQRAPVPARVRLVFDALIEILGALGSAAPRTTPSRT